jgi:hypothetical protein
MGVLANIARILSPAALQSADVLWLLQVDLGGRIFRFSTEGVAILDADGVSHLYTGSMDEIEYETNFELFGTSAGVPSLAITVLFPVSVAGLAQSGQHLSSATGQLSIWVQDTTLEDRVVILEGGLTDIQYGEEGDPVTFNIESDDFTDHNLFPDPAAAINGKTWPVADDKSLGAVYPFVFGKPGKTQDANGNDIDVPGSPGYLVQKNTSPPLNDGKLLIAGHRVLAATVRVFDKTALTEAACDVTHEVDGLGRVCAIAIIDATDGVDAVLGHEYFVKWSETLGGFPSRLPSRSGKAMNGAGELLTYMLQQSSIRFDEGRTAAVASQVGGYRVGGFVGERVSPWNWLIDNLLPLLPISIGVSGSEGLYPILWRMDATAEDAVYALVEGSSATGNCYRASTVSYADIDLANEIRINFAFDVDEDKPRSNTTVNGAPEDLPASGLTDAAVIMAGATDGTTGSFIDPSVTGWPTAYARFSQLRYGKRAIEIDSKIIYDRATADAIASWMARARATKPREVSYTVDTKLAWLQPGDVVTITDIGIRLTDQIATIQSMSIGEGEIALQLLIIEDPIRDANT